MEPGAHLDKVQLGHGVLGPHAQGEGAPGLVGVVQAHHGGAQEVRPPPALIVQHAEQRLDLRGEMLHLQGQPRMAAASEHAPCQGTRGPIDPTHPRGPGGSPHSDAGRALTCPLPQTPGSPQGPVLESLKTVHAGPVISPTWPPLQAPNSH